MKSLEIIHLQYSGEPPEVLGERIRQSINASDEEAPVTALYRRRGLETDLAILIHIDGVQNGAPSDAGLRLASALRTLGLVEHTLWDEIP